ncbi:Hypothetical Protein FCC1311_048192 [Hondaea fermentalgiana]|uniref:Uncharacterized protein n=1 Tax=Hondaea fermentalgiana TaxID=2315210 RepID=A0A2R5GFR7_9STRA|nr:Hypothetical Protein FCC1311_048192 [Hondaea fermentalgiana]|eukprot:GBG28598.1 Hypothetical Protein FCC1311_048192 [Hondaea fermentalgiana]
MCAAGPGEAGAAGGTGASSQQMPSDSQSESSSSVTDFALRMTGLPTLRADVFDDFIGVPPGTVRGSVPLDMMDEVLLFLAIYHTVKRGLHVGKNVSTDERHFLTAVKRHLVRIETCLVIDFDRSILLLGRAYLPETDPDYRGIKLHARDVDQAFCGALAGIPVLIEHDESARVGHVLHAYLTPQLRHLMVFLLIDADPWCATMLPAQLGSRCGGRRLFNDLSFGHVVHFEKSAGFTQVHHKTPVEISVVRRGDNPGTFIFDWWYVSAGAQALVESVVPSKIKEFEWVDFVDQYGYNHSSGENFCAP